MDIILLFLFRVSSLIFFVGCTEEKEAGEMSLDAYIDYAKSQVSIKIEFVKGMFGYESWSFVAQGNASR